MSLKTDRKGPEKISIKDKKRDKQIKERKENEQSQERKNGNKVIPKATRVTCFTFKQVDQ